MESKTVGEFDKKRKQQQELLSKQIAMSPFYSNKKQIKVYSMEASVGKTYTLINTLNKMATINKNAGCV
ncbi:hypothetical protein IZY60_14440 [Lutibacter sp. B2]|nr:hypothetical protein [Lutibacter sp. B2]